MESLYIQLLDVTHTKMIVRVALASSCMALAIFYGIYGNSENETETNKPEVNEKRKKKKKQAPPGPQGLPFFGVGFRIDIKKLHENCHQWKREYGNIIMIKIFGRNIVILNSTETIRKAFTSEEFSPFMSDRPLNFIGEHVLYGYKDVLLRRYDEEFRKTKSLMIKCVDKNGFQSKHFNDLANEEFRSVLSKFSSSVGNDVDPLRILMPSFCKMIGMMFSGEALKDDDRLTQCITDIDYYGDIMIQPSVHGVYKLFPWIRRCCGYYGNLFQRVIEARENLFAMLVSGFKKKRDDKTKGFTNDVFHAQETDADWLTDEHVNAMMMDLINTSVLTTKSVMSGFIVTWLHYPDVQRKIQEEIDQVIGKDREPSIDDYSKMPYTQACIHELLRYQSHLPLTAAHANLSQDVEFEGYTIPKGSVILGNLYSAHHEDCTWEDPWVYRPERFLMENGDIVPPEHPALQNILAFGIGERKCVGKHMAYHRIFLYTVHLLRAFNFQTLDDVPLVSDDPRQMVAATPVILPHEFACKVVPR